MSFFPKHSVTGSGIHSIDGEPSALTLSTGIIELEAGTATVVAPIMENSIIFLTSKTDGGTPGWLRVSNRVLGTGFTISSSSFDDTSVVAYLIIESEIT